MRRSTKVHAPTGTFHWTIDAPAALLDRLGLNLGYKAALISAAAVLMGAALGWWLFGPSLWPSLSARDFGVRAAATAMLAAAFVGVLVHYLVGARLAHFAEVLDQTGPEDELARVRKGSSDEVGDVAQAVNRLLARLTSIRASMIDQGRELGEAQRELILKADLAAKTEELGQRLEERAMLFDILRMTTSSLELEEMLHALVNRVGQLLRLREVLIFLHDPAQDGFVVQATYGFQSDTPLRGRSVRAGEGFTGRVCMTRTPLVIGDLSQQKDYQGFWGAAERRGSLAAVPIAYQNQLLGVLTVTRPEDDPITELHQTLLSAIADNAALAIRNAQLFRRMRELSSHDELTGLPNQRRFQAQLQHEIARARRFRKPLSLLALDIDGFARINQRYGRSAGDAALCHLGQLIARSIRRVDTLARVGSDELMILLPSADLPGSTVIAEKLRLAVEQDQLDGDIVSDRLTISIGMSHLQEADDRDGTGLLARAQQALKDAKATGRNRVIAR